MPLRRRHRRSAAARRANGSAPIGSIIAIGALIQVGPEGLVRWLAVAAIYKFEMSRWFRTLGQSIASPVISTSLYFIVFGAAIGARMGAIDGVTYGAFIIPGLMMLSILNESIGNASFGNRTQSASIVTQEICADCHSSGGFKGVDIVHGQN